METPLCLNLMADSGGGKSGLMCQLSGLEKEAWLPSYNSKGIVLFDAFKYNSLSYF
jgi:hypothetical protein